MGKIYLFYGEEKYDLNNRVEKIKKEFNNLEIGVNLFYVNKENINELENITQGVTFFGSQKLIIIKDTNLKFNANYITNLDSDIVVIIIEESVDKRLTEYKTISKIAECVEFKHMDQREMISYIVNTLRKYNISINHDVAEYMQIVCGEDKTNNINELQKLVIYVGSGGSVTTQIIDSVCSKTLNAKIFDVLSMIINKNTKEAIRSLNELLEQKEPIIKIYIMLYKQIKQMYMIKLLKEKGNSTNIAEIIGMHPFVFKNLNKTVDKYSLNKLKQLLYSFDEYDEKTKNGEMDFEIGLKKIICSM